MCKCRESSRARLRRVDPHVVALAVGMPAAKIIIRWRRRGGWWRDGDGANGSRGWIASLHSSTNDDSNNNSTSTSTSNATTTPQYVSIETPCVACASVPCVNPFRLLPCGHVHCYYCAAARVAKSGDDSFRCADCGAKATGMRRSAFRKAEG